MPESSWVHIFQHGVRRGGGVLLTARLVVTAAHCVHHVEVREASSGLRVSVADRESVDAKLVDLVEDCDLALLELSQPLGNTLELPRVSRGNKGDVWFAPCRPSPSDPELDGKVNGSLLYECQAGATIWAVQLTTDSNLGNYQGYSGGPVFLWPTGDRRLLGVLIEQHPDHIDPQRATNTLFAAAMEEALDQFPTLQNAYLLRWLVGRDEGMPTRGSGDTDPKSILASSMDSAVLAESHGPQIAPLSASHDELISKIIVRFLLGQHGVDPAFKILYQARVSESVIEFGRDADGSDR
jgi:hypothetical protein